MKEENTVLCCSNAYEKKFYLNQDFQALPQHIKDELKIMCVLYTEEIGGILTLEYDENGTLEFSVRSEEGDFSSMRSAASCGSRSCSGTSGSCWNRWSCFTRYFSWRMRCIPGSSKHKGGHGTCC